MTLADLKPGQHAVIETIDLEDAHVTRLMVLGLVEGTELVLRGMGIGGDPLEFNLADAKISLRREQARRFRIRERQA